MPPNVNGTSSVRLPESAATPAAQRSNMPPPPVPSQTRSPIITSDENLELPVRHPRPLTAAELYLECEKEQEAVVNRLTRELTALRARSASVASNASRSSTSTSASLLPVDISDPNPAHQLTGATHPTPSRRRRRSSSISARSIPTPSTTASNLSTSQAPPANTVNTAGMSQASVARAAAAPGNLSRQPSISASGASTPARRSMDLSRFQMHNLPHRPSISRDISYASSQTGSITAQAGTPAPQRIPSPALSPQLSVQSAMQHYAETTAYRNEMESVKAENEALKQRVRALERALRARRRDSSQSDVASRPEVTSRYSRDTLSSTASTQGSAVAAWAAGSGVGGVAGPRERSESQSTTASSRRGIPVDEEVRVGESAASLGARGA